MIVENASHRGVETVLSDNRKKRLSVLYNILKDLCEKTNIAIDFACTTDFWDRIEIKISIRRVDGFSVKPKIF